MYRLNGVRLVSAACALILAAGRSESANGVEDATGKSKPGRPEVLKKLVEVKGASYAPLKGLAPGSKEAQALQKKAVETLNLPLEVKTKKTGIRFRLIPAGTFMMGAKESPSEVFSKTGLPQKHEESVEEWFKVEHPRHEVTLTKPFYMGAYEITQSQWKQVMGSNPSRFDQSGPNAPVEEVSWKECREFCSELCRLEGVAEGTFRLPTEAEWEYACRAGTETAFCYGASLDASQANFKGNYPYGNGRKGVDRWKTVKVGSFKPNAWGLYDMHGNVWEWCADWFGEDYYEKSPETNPLGPESGSLRVIRGGCWYGPAGLCRCAYRNWVRPDRSYYVLGFRVALAPGQ